MPAKNTRLSFAQCEVVFDFVGVDYPYFLQSIEINC